MLDTLQSIVPFLWSLLALWSFIHGDTACGIGFMVLYHLDKQTTYRDRLNAMENRLDVATSRMNIHLNKTEH